MKIKYVKVFFVIQHGYILLKIQHNTRWFRSDMNGIRFNLYIKHHKPRVITRSPNYGIASVEQKYSNKPKRYPFYSVNFFFVGKKLLWKIMNVVRSLHEVFPDWRQAVWCAYFCYNILPSAANFLIWDLHCR